VKSLATIVGLLAALGVGYVVYQKSLTRSGGAQLPPMEQIDVVAIRSSLLVIGQAERQYVVAHGTYGTIEELQQDGPPTIGTEQRGYRFTVSPDGARAFTATATPTDPGKPGWPTLVMTETLVITETRN
jgi:hypothetical protein